MDSDVTVLLVSSDQYVIRWLGSHLESDGFSVLVASDGSSAIDLMRGEAPDLVLMGFVPPSGHSADEPDQEQMDGFQLLRRLRLESSRTGVIVIGREHDEEIKLYFLDSGADDYLTWPCNRRELMARIRAIVRRTRADPKVRGTQESILLRKECAHD